MALLSYYSRFQLDFDKMTDDELAIAWNRLEYSLKKTNQYNNI